MPRTMEKEERKHLHWMQWRTGYWGWWDFIQG